MLLYLLPVEALSPRRHYYRTLGAIGRFLEGGHSQLSSNSAYACRTTQNYFIGVDKNHWSQRWKQVRKEGQSHEHSVYEIEMLQIF